MLNFGKASKQTHTKKICQLKSHQLAEIPTTEETKKICCPDVTKGDGLFLKGWIPQYDRVDNHSREQCMGHSKITRILKHKTKKNLENVSKEPSYAFVMNIKT